MADHETQSGEALILADMLDAFHITCTPYAEILPEDEPTVELIPENKEPTGKFTGEGNLSTGAYTWQDNTTDFGRSFSTNDTPLEPASADTPPAPVYTPLESESVYTPPAPAYTPLESESAYTPPAPAYTPLESEFAYTPPAPAYTPLESESVYTPPARQAPQNPIEPMQGFFPSPQNQPPPNGRRFSHALSNIGNRLGDFFSSLPPLWGVDVFLISVSTVGMLSILLNLSAVLESLAIMIYRLVNSVLSVTFFILIVGFLLQALLRPRRWW